MLKLYLTPAARRWQSLAHCSAYTSFTIVNLTTCPLSSITRQPSLSISYFVGRFYSSRSRAPVPEDSKMATMDDLFRNSIQQAKLLKKPSSLIPWKADEPWPQPYYQWDIDSEVWQPIKQLASPVKDQAPSISTISLYSWNIDFMLPAAEARMNAALAHLEEATSQLPSTTAAVINLQECSPSDLITVSQKHWIRERFYITDLDSSAWGSDLYGTTMLVDRRLQISSCFRVHFSATQMERDALFVDVTMPVTSRKLRLADTHLESLALDPPLRPSQMRLAAKYLQDGEGLAGAIIAGDFNAIQPFDASLHSDNNLHDAYLDLGGREDCEDGFTWGQQALPALRERFGCSRMDKAFFCGTGIRLQAFERFGIDVEIDESKKKQRDRLLALGFGKAWVTDHLGIKATFAVVNDTRL